MENKEYKIINKFCSICGNESGYGVESLKSSTYIINGIKIVLCCPCEDDILRQILSKRLKDSTYELVKEEINLNDD